MEMNKYNYDDYLYFAHNGAIRGFHVKEIKRTRKGGWAYGDDLTILKSEEDVSLVPPDVDATIQKYINEYETGDNERGFVISKNTFLYLAKKAGFTVKANV